MSKHAAQIVDHRVHVAIIDSLYRFGAGQDLKDPDLFESAFASNAILDFVQPASRFGVKIPVFEGRTMIVESVLGTTAGLDTTHTVTNPRILAVEGGRAELFALVEAQHLPKQDHSRHLLLKNFYFLDLVHEGQDWLISAMRIQNVWSSGDPAVLFPQARSESLSSDLH